MGNILKVTYREQIIEMLDKLIANCSKCNDCQEISNTAFNLLSTIEEYSQKH